MTDTSNNENSLNESNLKSNSNLNLIKSTDEDDKILIKLTEKTRGPNSKISMKKWTDEEDKILIKLAEKTKGKQWKWIATRLPGKNDTQCRSRWERIRPGMKQGRWTHMEDELLKDLHKTFGHKYSKIAKCLVNRTGKQVRDRIKNVYDSRINHNIFDPEKDELIYQMYLKKGSKWKEIRDEFFPDRSIDFIKNRFYSYYRRRHKVLESSSKFNFSTHNEESSEEKNKFIIQYLFEENIIKNSNIPNNKQDTPYVPFSNPTTFNFPLYYKLLEHVLKLKENLMLNSNYLYTQYGNLNRGIENITRNLVQINNTSEYLSPLINNDSFIKQNGFNMEIFIELVKSINILKEPLTVTSLLWNHFNILSNNCGLN